MKKLAKGALVIGFAGFAGVSIAGCSTTYTRDELIKDLKANGVSETVAVCTADEYDKQGIKLEKYTEASKDSKQVEILAQCLAKEQGVTLPTTAKS